MPNKYYLPIIKRIEENFGKIRRIGTGYTLFNIPSVDVNIYFRYSKISKASKNVNKTFYGLKKEDIQLMQTKKSFICLITDDESKNLFIPFQQFENYFLEIPPSNDGQYKTLCFYKPTGTEIYIANIGKFNAENYLNNIEIIFNIQLTNITMPKLTHEQIQSLIGTIGIKKGYDIWFPERDKNKIDYSIVDNSKVIESLPCFEKSISNIISEVDIIWIEKSRPISFWEVEHTTTIYSGLLRFNDILLTIHGAHNFNIVAENEREAKFSKEINRPTFTKNKLIDNVAFIDYSNIYNWYYNLTNHKYEP